MTGHRIYTQPATLAKGDIVTMRQELEYAVDFAAPDAADDPAEVAADVALAQAALSLAPESEGMVGVDDATMTAFHRLIEDANDYAMTCGYAADPTCTPVEQEAGRGLLAVQCWAPCCFGGRAPNLQGWWRR